MKLQILKENLDTAVRVVTPFATSKGQLPILSHILIEAKGKELYFSATDLDVGIKLRVGGKILEEGVMAVPAKVLSDLVSSMQLGTVELAATEGQLKISSGRMKAKIQGMDASEYPEVNVGEKVGLGVFPMSEMKYVMDRVGFAVSNDDSRPVLTGVYWDLSGGEMAATDGYRLSVVKRKEMRVNGEFEQDSLLVGGRVLKEATSVFEEMGVEEMEIGYVEKGKQVVFESEDVVVVGRVLEGEFPNYGGIVPQDVRVRVEVDRKELNQAVRSAAIFARDSANIVKFELDGEGLLISANAPQVGENVVQAEVKYLDKGSGIIAYNSRYLSEFLSKADTDLVELGINESLQPGLFLEKESEDYIHVIMPVRVRGEE